MAVDDMYTKLLLHMDGADGGTTFIDEAGHTITAAGGACTRVGVDIASNKTYYASSSYNSTFLPGKAFDKSESTAWNAANSADNEWLAVDLGLASAIDTLRFMPHYYQGAMVKDFTLYGSNNSTNGADGTWTQIYVGTHENAKTWQSFAVNSEAAYRWIKIVGNNSYRADFVGAAIAELELIKGKFGTAIASFNGSGDGLTVPNSAEFEFGLGDFTIDGWFYFLNNTKGWQLVIDKASNAVAAGWVLQLNASNQLVFWTSSNGSSWDNQVLSSTYVPILSTWTHIAIIRNGSAWTMYVNGTPVATGTYAGSILEQSIDLGIGKRAGSSSYTYQGNIDELRISKGIARWTTNFTPLAGPYVPVEYKTSGTAVFGPFTLPIMTADPASSSIDWTENLPEGTTLSVKAAIVDTSPQESDYQTVTNGDAIPGISQASSGKNLYIKAYLSTSDVSKTPKLLSLGYGVVEQPDTTKVKLALTDNGRLKYPAGDVTVSYQKANGNLAGELGGQVDDFTQLFTPTNINEVFNPNDVENLTLSLSQTSEVIEVIYRDFQEQENISLTITQTSEIIHVNDIPQ